MTETPMELLPCPFCGGAAIFHRLGTQRQSCIVWCSDCNARLESGETGDACGSAWNTRVSSHAPQGEGLCAICQLPEREHVYGGAAYGECRGFKRAPQAGGERRLLQTCADILGDMVKVGLAHTIPEESCGYYIGPDLLRQLREALPERDAPTPADEPKGDVRGALITDEMVELAARQIDAAVFINYAAVQKMERKRPTHDLTALHEAMESARKKAREALKAALSTPSQDEGELRRALEDIALLDEADGHELTVKHAFRAVAIATSTLGKHPSEIYADRFRAAPAAREALKEKP